MTKPYFTFDELAALRHDTFTLLARAKKRLWAFATPASRIYAFADAAGQREVAHYAAGEVPLALHRRALRAIVDFFEIRRKALDFALDSFCSPDTILRVGRFVLPQH